MKYLAVGLGLFSWLAIACSGSSNAKLEGSGGQSSGGQAGAGNRPCATTSDCAVGTCSAGTCKDVTCVPNTTSCATNGDNAIVSCDSNGTQSGIGQTCPAGTYCLERSGSASCSSNACFPGDPMCVGTVSTQCKPDGTGPKPGGTDCAKDKQLCYSGQCRDQLCAPGQKLCDNNTLYLCAEGGSSRVSISVCGSGQVCDATQGGCKSRVCEPGKLGCDSTRVVTCNDAGSGWILSGTDCADKKKACSAGSCLPIVCSPNARTCKDNAVYFCSPDGTAQTLSQSCGSSQRCINDVNYAYCDRSRVSRASRLATESCSAPATTTARAFSTAVPIAPRTTRCVSTVSARRPVQTGQVVL